ncbi:DNA alkylation repair protein [Labilibaculum sp.]|uniref:DNA alkylation repair protein n=1 Tax=Labilibaculum sp. TaxID=2060723 RepID=UPI003567D33F
MLKSTVETNLEMLLDAFRKNANREQAIRMEAYLKNKFPFLGLRKPVRVLLDKSFLRDACQSKYIDWEMVFYLFELEEREFHHLALEYLQKMQEKLKKQDIIHLERLILCKSWWDSVDALSPLVGVLCRKNPVLKKEVLEHWMLSSNIWLKRVSITFQLKYKNQTDSKFLEKAILANHLSKEFFVNKAIGWALRQYSKFNAAWVRNFIATHSLSPLSVREGSKYL